MENHAVSKKIIKLHDFFHVYLTEKFENIWIELWIFVFIFPSLNGFRIHNNSL